jgi:hypothetical protein
MNDQYLLIQKEHLKAAWPRRAQPSRQRRDYGASLAIFAGVGLQR